MHRIPILFFIAVISSAIAKGDGKIRSYHSEGKAINKDEAIPMIAVTTTSGTASEVTNISVLTDVEKNLKNKPCAVN